MDDYFRVAPSAKHMSEGLQFGHEFLIVVYLAIEDHDNAMIFVVQRLLSRREVYDRKPTMAKTDARPEVKSTLIGPSVELRLVHPVNERTGDFAPAACRCSR